MVKTTRLGGTASDVVVAKVAHGLMTMTWRPVPIPDDQAFESIKSGIDALPEGTKMMLNSAQFYGHGWSVANLELLARFYEKYPDYTDKTFLSVKGGAIAHLQLSGKPEDIRNSVDQCIAALRGTKKIDLFQPARIDPEVPVEVTVGALVELVREGKFDHIGLSECSAETLRRGHAVHSISVVEIEISPMSYEEETKKVLVAAAELDIAVAAYSPLGHGMTTGAIKSINDLPHDSPIRQFERLKEENWKYNKRLVDALLAQAAKKGCTPAQLSIAWVGALGEKVIPLPGSTRKDRTLENLFGGDIELTEEDLDEIAKIMETNPVRGHRYSGNDRGWKLWG